MTKAFLIHKFGQREVLLALALVFIASCSQKAPTGKTHCIKSSDGEIISYNVYGKGEVTLVFVHGWSCDSRYWREQVTYFAQGYQVVTIDLAGHGESEQSREVYSQEGFGQDIKAVVEELDAKKVILIGHSMGGGVIAQAAKLLPDRTIGLIGVDTLHNVADDVSKEQIAQIVDGFKKDFKAYMRVFVEQMMVFGIDPELKEWIIDDISSAPQKVAMSALEQYMSWVYEKKTAEIFWEIKAPVRCVNADLWPTNIEVNRRYMQSFDVKIMKDVGHFLMLERPDEFNKLLNRSIKEIISSPQAGLGANR